jgi:hypothetical protein
MRIDQGIYATSDLDAAAVALDAVGHQGRTAHLTGVREALSEPFLPFSIERPARPSGERQSGPGFGWIEVAGDAPWLERWLGGAGLPVRVVEGAPAVLALGVGERELHSEP